MAMNRRQITRAFLFAGMTGGLHGQTHSGTELWVNPASGDDKATGEKSNPLRTLAEAARRVNQSQGSGPVTIYLSEGIHAIAETVLFRPERRSFTRESRLTVRAEVLPDDPEWHTGRMPTLIHSMPLPRTWNGRPDPLGGAADGMLIETSHVTIQGLKFLGLPVVETPKPGLIRRLYGISRLRPELEDLEIAQCMFLGDDITVPLHVAVIAHGSAVNVHHCIFRGVKISVVYWTSGSHGHAMTHCFCDSVYGSAVWTAGVQNDFVYRNNVVSNCNYVWTQSRVLTGSAAGVKPPEWVRYKAVNCYLAGNRRLAGSGTGAREQYEDIDPSLVELAGTRVAGHPVDVERDQTRRNCLHPVAASEAAALGAGLFVRM